MNVQRRPWIRSPGLASHAYWGSSSLTFPAGRSEKDGHLSGTTQLAKGPAQAREAGSGPPRVGAGRCQLSQAPARCALPASPSGLREKRAASWRLAVHAAVLGPAGYAGTRSPRPPPTTRSPWRENSNPQAASREQDRAEPTVQGGPKRLASAPRPSPAQAPAKDKEQKRPAACPGTHRLCRAVCPSC